MISKSSEHAFSLELKSKEHLKSVRLGEEGQEEVSIEGFLGELIDVKLVEQPLLEVTGANGTFRLDISEEELRMYTKALRDKANAIMR